MKTFNVTVQKRMLVTGSLEIEAETEAQALDRVEDIIASGELQTTDERILWQTDEYEDGSLITVDADEV